VAFSIPGYKPVEKLGSDRLGVRYRGIRRSDSTDVLIRILRRKLFPSERSVDEFGQRLFDLSELSHPNIASLLEYHRIEERFVLIYRLPPGKPLQQVLEESEGPLSRGRAVIMAMQLLAALEYADREASISHGELIPANVYVSGSGGVSVLEPGLVDVTGRIGMSTAGIPAESLPYLAPERLLERGVFHRSDIYSVGMLLYRLLAGRFPFPVTGSTEVVESVKRKKFPAPTRFNDAIPEDLSTAIRRAILKHPSRRLPDAESLRELVEPFAREEPRPEPERKPAPRRKTKKTAREKRLEARKKRAAEAEAAVDLGMRQLADGKKAEAVASARKAFDIYPSCRNLPELLDRLEEEKPRKPEEKPAKGEVFEGLFEKEVGEEAEEIPGLLESAPSHTDPERESYLISEIRSQMKQNNFREAAIVAGDAHLEFPDNSTITELYVRLDKLFHPEKYRVPERELRRRREEAEAEAEAAAEAAPAISEEELEQLEEEEYVPAMAPSRKWVYIGGAAGLLGLVAVFFLVVMPRLAGGPEEPAGPSPYQVALRVRGPESPTVLFDGEEVEADRQGSYRLEGTDFGPLEVEVRSPGHESINRRYDLDEGTTITDTLQPPPLGTGTAVLDLSAEILPEGQRPESPGEVRYFLDTNRVDPHAEVPTGRYVARAELEGFRSIPETILVSRPDTFSTALQLGPLGTSEIRLSVAAGIPGSADFYVDGTRVGGGRSVTYPADLGTHTIAVRMEGRESWSRLIELGREGYQATVSLPEVERTGQLLIAPEPWASVEIDGQSYGETPRPPIELEEGEYTVRLSNPEYEDQVQTVRITAGEDTRISYSAQLRATGLEEITGGGGDEEEQTQPPQILSRTEPEYPEEALAQEGLSGSVTLYVTVSEEGRVTSARVAHDGVGYGFAEAAIDAVADWEFSPGTRDGQPVEATRTVTIPYNP
jgi:TonB family protein